MVYTADTDPLCYPGTTVLRNILDLRTQDELDEYELAVFLTRSDEPWPPGELDYVHYLALHHHLFQDVYEWAGQVRTIRIGKGGNWFCYPEYIDGEMRRIFGELEETGHLVGLEARDFALKAAHLLAEINAVHPFREGNGRTQLAFLSVLAENANLPFHDDVLDRQRVIGAMVESFSGSEAPLAQLIYEIVSPDL
ncbi:adenosine monophosphate-protein transferase [Shinella sp. AETb1-6]|uniref:Fic/DOC family protein n=1 Tax=Shinella sp. AETb1-6 TaxID=2692210 RepID=UPI00136B1654|nr:Fic family protein [Shinella sp. AETb1-6]MDP9592102.1 cell filamentation protein [Shinella zoogloeoides]MXN54216.1 adenosine monophosphate-protein transferase [Shinella sp. AETb1-6]